MAHFCAIWGAHILAPFCSISILPKTWQNSTELVRDYQAYADELEEDNKELGKLFSEFAEDEAVHAAKLLDPLRGYEK